MLGYVLPQLPYSSSVQNKLTAIEMVNEFLCVNDTETPRKNLRHPTFHEWLQHGIGFTAPINLFVFWLLYCPIILKTWNDKIDVLPAVDFVMFL